MEDGDTQVDKDASNPSSASPSSPPPPTGAFAMWARDCEEDTVKPIEGKLSGKVPDWLSGRLTRNGPGKLGHGDTKYNHMFDGSAVLHQFNINNGNITYQSRFLQSEAYKRNTKANRIVMSGFGTAAHPDPCKTILQRFMSMFEPPGKTKMDNCLVNVVHLGDELYALTETTSMRRVDPHTLDCIGGQTNLEGYVAINHATAHPHVDPDGTVYNMGNSYSGSSGPTYNIVKFPPARQVEDKTESSMEQAQIVASIPCQWKMHPSYYHSFGITEKYFIFIEQPLVLNVRKLLLYHYIGKPFMEALEWYPNHKTRFHLVERETGRILPTKYTSDAFFTFHHVNAYEKDNHLVVDVCVYDNGKALCDFLLKNLQENSEFEFDSASRARLRRFVLPLLVDDAQRDTNLVRLAGSSCEASKMADDSVHIKAQEMAPDYHLELPRINYQHNGREYTVTYGVDNHHKRMEFFKLVKVNMVTGKTQEWQEEGKMVSEPVFVAAPGATAEDQGVVLSALLSKEDARYTALLVLDPKSWTEMARVEFVAQGSVTSTFHGQFAGNDETVHLY